MKKKIIKFLKSVITILIIIIILLVLLFLTCKYILKDTKLFDNFSVLGESIKEVIFGIKKEYTVQLKNENLQTESQKSKCYYYLQLDENAKYIYMVLENNIQNLIEGKENIELPTNLCEVANKNKGVLALVHAFQNAWDAFIKDKPEIFCFDGNKFSLIASELGAVNKRYELEISKGDYENYYIDGFKDSEQVKNANKQLEIEKQNILSTINNNYSTYQKIKIAHDWIVNNVEYDSEMNQSNNGNCYGAIVEKKAICEGYAEAFKVLMDDLEIPCIMVSGIGLNTETGKEEKHAWNYVYLNNSWYAVDVTWDDPTINTNKSIKESDAVKYRYFLKGEKTMKIDHEVTGIISVNGKKFIYPELSQKDY